MSLVPKLMNSTKNCVKLRFVNSYRFLSSNLDKLASFLSKDKLRILQHEFSNLLEENFNLLIRKSVFSYEYIDCTLKSWSCVYLLASRFTVHWQTIWYLRTLTRTSSTCSSPSEYSVNIPIYIWKRTYCWPMSLKISATVTSRVMSSIPCIITPYWVSRGTWMLKHTDVRFELFTLT